MVSISAESTPKSQGLPCTQAMPNHCHAADFLFLQWRVDHGIGETVGTLKGEAWQAESWIEQQVLQVVNQLNIIEP